jgi:hypothetical protein
MLQLIGLIFSKMPKQISEEQYQASFKEGAMEDRKRQKALENALDIRKFEISLYWTRATYFWTFITVALAGFGAAQTLDQPVRTDLAVFVCCVGYFVSFCWYCANRGSKQWQENWENHVDLLEDDVNGPLYKTVISRSAPTTLGEHLRNHLTGPYSFSVSKINQIISLYITLLWVFLFFYSLPEWSTSARVNWWYVIAAVSTLVATGIVLKYATTDPHDYSNVARLRSSGLRDPESTA